LRRDLVQVAQRRLNGHAKTTTSRRVKTFDHQPKRVAISTREVLQPLTLRVVEVVPETTDAISVVLARPDGQDFDFIAGMFFTVMVTINGQEHRRAYSISSPSQQRQRVSITIKRVKEGLVSNWLNDHLKVGDSLRVLGPSGTFILKPATESKRHLLLVGGGSGITPLMSILRSVLMLEPLTQVSVLYGNRSWSDVIFADALSMLKEEYTERLDLIHVLEMPPEHWQGAVGRLDQVCFATQLDNRLKQTPLQNLEVYLCGPEPMMQGVVQELQQRGLADHRIHQEKFTSQRSALAPQQLSAQTITVELDGRQWQTTAQGGQTLLEAGLSSGVPMPFSCTLGGCGRCRVKVVSGEVSMPEPNCLLPDERAQNYALACIACPITPVSVVVDTPQIN